MKDKNRKTIMIRVVMVAAGALYLAGLLTFASGCGPKDDGTWMTCHWANQALIGLAAILLADAMLLLLAQHPHVRIGISVAMIPAALLGAILPGGLIGLCMMNTMHCHTVMRPFSIVMSVIIMILAMISMLLERKSSILPEVQAGVSS